MLDMLFTTDAMRAVFCDAARVQRHARLRGGARARRGGDRRHPAGGRAVDRPVLRRCRAYDFAALARGRAQRRQPRHPAGGRADARASPTIDPEARGYVHWGATSQDAIDTGLVLQLRDALALIDDDLDRLSAALATQVRAHRATPMVGRTWLQQALPVTLGLKLAGGARRRRPPSRAHRDAASAHRGAAVRRRGGHARVARRARHRRRDGARGGPRPRRRRTSPWHTQRDHICEVATTLGLIVATLGKLARDVALLAQTEVGEAFEPAAPGRGGSSTLPHKRNPVGCRDRARRRGARAQSRGDDARRRGAGARARARQLARRMGHAAGDLHARRRRARRDDGRRRRTGRRCRRRMRANLDASRGQIFAEAVQMALGARARPRRGARAGRRSVQARGSRKAGICATPSATSRSFARSSTTRRSPRLFDPRHYLGVADTFIDRALRASTSATQEFDHALRRRQRCANSLPLRRAATTRRSCCCRIRSAPNLDMWDAADARARRALSRAALRQPRPRPVGSDARAVRRSHGSRATRWALLDALAHRSRASSADCRWAAWSGSGWARTRRSASRRLALVQHRRRRSAPPDVWNARIDAVMHGGMAAIVDGVVARWFTPAFVARRAGRRSRRSRDDAARPRPRTATSRACAAVRDMDQRATRRAHRGADARRLPARTTPRRRRPPAASSPTRSPARATSSSPPRTCRTSRRQPTSRARAHRIPGAEPAPGGPNDGRSRTLRSRDEGPPRGARRRARRPLAHQAHRVQRRVPGPHHALRVGRDLDAAGPAATHAQPADARR